MDYFDNPYGYYGDFGSIWDFLGVFMAGAAVILLAVGAVLLLLYILNAIGLMTIARYRGLPNPWLAWIPLARSYTLGAIWDDINAREEGNPTSYRYVLLATGLLSGLMVLAAGSASSALLFSALATNAAYANFVLKTVALHRLFKTYRPYNTILYTVLCAIPFTSFMQSVFPFVLRHEQPGGGGYPPPPPGGYPPPPGGYAPSGDPGRYYPGGGYPPQGGYGPGPDTPPPGYRPPPPYGNPPPPRKDPSEESAGYQGED